MTTREFYDFVVALPRTARPLAEYLRALYALTVPYRDEPGVPLDTFAELLREALTSEPAPERPDAPNEFEQFLWDQVEDLPGLPLEDGVKIYFGAKSELSGRIWFNAHVSTYLECAARGRLNSADDENADVPLELWEDLWFFLHDGQYNE